MKTSKRGTLFSVLTALGVIIGIYNLFSTLVYYLTTYKELMGQGIPVAYLVFVSILGSWWIIMSLATSFLTLSFLKREQKTVELIMYFLLGALGSIFLSGGMPSVFFLVALLFYSLF